MRSRIHGAKALALAFACTLLLAQKPVAPEQVDSCGAGLHKDHPCHCMRHQSDAQNKYMEQCQGKDPSVQKIIECLRAMPDKLADHCAAVESYGNWADESKPMPDQCTSACKRKDCRCAEGASHPGKDSKTVCHFGRYSEEGNP